MNASGQVARNTAGDFLDYLKTSFENKNTAIISSTYWLIFILGINGNRIGEENRGIGFAFSIENLAAKMLAEYKTDILNSDNVYRLTCGITIADSLFSHYLVGCYDFASLMPQQVVISFLVDSNTRKILHTLHTNTKEPASVV